MAINYGSIVLAVIDCDQNISPRPSERTNDNETEHKECNQRASCDLKEALIMAKVKVDIGGGNILTSVVTRMLSKILASRWVKE